MRRILLLLVCTAISTSLISCKTKGYVITMDGRKIRGNILVNNYTDITKVPKNNLKIVFKVGAKKKILKFKADEVKYVKIKQLSSKDSIEFTPLHVEGEPDVLWQVLGSRGNIGIYFRNWFIPNGPLAKDGQDANELLLVSDKTQIKIIPYQ